MKKGILTFLFVFAIATLFVDMNNYGMDKIEVLLANFPFIC